MIKQKKVLILYASYGDGHRQVTSALEQGFKDQGIQTITVDLYKRSHPLLNAIIHFFYMKSFGKWASRVYGWSYYSTKDLGHIEEQPRNFFAIGMHTLKKIIQKEQPDAVINTFPFAAMPVLMPQIGKNIRTYAVLTDFCLHDFWIHQEIDKFFVATTDLKKAIVQKGICQERIMVTGIPLRQSFMTRLSGPNLLRQNGLKTNRKTVLVMVGAFGVLQNIKHLCEALLKVPDIQLMVVCGKNERCRKQLTPLFQSHSNVKVLGYVSNMAELMATSSCMVTKAGGITLSETISMELPLIIYRPIPGQEKENASYLASKGAAILAYQMEEVVDAVNQLLFDEWQNLKMKQALRSLRQTNATIEVVSQIVEDFAKPEVYYRRPVTALPRRTEIIRL